VIIPHPSAVDVNRPVAVNISEPFVTDEYKPPPQMSDSGNNVTVSYSLWIGSNITEKRSINITADHNVTFYEIMQRASDLDSAFTYAIELFLTT
jgi:gastric intrinsic factor